MSGTQPRRRTLDAQLGVLVALAAGSGRPSLAAAARRIAGSARVEEVELAGVPATLYRPARGALPLPRVVVLPGVTRQGRRHPAFVGVGTGLAAAGTLAAVVEPPGLSIGELTPDVLARTNAAVEAFAADPEGTGSLALAGVSGGATLALALAGAPALAARVSAVLALSPLCDIHEALRLVTTDRYGRGALISFRPGSFLRLVLARSAIAWLEDGLDRRRLREHVLELEDYGAEPLRAFRSWPLEELEREARAIVRLLANDDPSRFDELYEALPDDLRETVGLLSPLRVAGDVRAPVELVVAREDKYVPLADAVALASACPTVRMTVIDSLEHAVPRVSPSAARDLARLDGALVRFLSAVRSPSYSRG